MSRVIDLQGPDGNAFYEFSAMRTEMMSGGYNNLLRVFKAKFGDLVTFANAPEEYDEELA